MKGDITFDDVKREQQDSQVGRQTARIPVRESFCRGQPGRPPWVASCDVVVHVDAVHPRESVELHVHLQNSQQLEHFQNGTRLEPAQNPTPRRVMPDPAEFCTRPVSDVLRVSLTSQSRSAGVRL